MAEIIEKVQESSGRWRIRAIASASESMFLWFDIEPEQADIDRVIDQQLRQRVLDNPVIEITELSCTAWQFRRALNALGLREMVEQAVAASADPDIIDGWDYADLFLRYDPLVVQFGALLGQTEEEMDQLFMLAKTL